MHYRWASTMKSTGNIRGTQVRHYAFIIAHDPCGQAFPHITIDIDRYHIFYFLFTLSH
jgi:hypothetical protein